jgi:hypothetical protein
LKRTVFRQTWLKAEAGGACVRATLPGIGFFGGRMIGFPRMPPPDVLAHSTSSRNGLAIEMRVSYAATDAHLRSATAQRQARL